MVTKKIPISFNEEELKRIKELGTILGLGDPDTHFGVTPKVVKFCINCIKDYFYYINKVIPDLKDAEMSMLARGLTHIRNSQKEAENRAKICLISKESITQ